ncbi:hypothetical protein ACET3Z_031349 [Daucus carota]
MTSSESVRTSSMAAMNNKEGKSEMDIDEEIRFVCPNFAKDYTVGVMKLPKDFCLEKVIAYLKGYCYMFRQALCGMVYIARITFALKIFNPYGVEISYDVASRSKVEIDSAGSLLSTSELEVEKLCGTLTFNAYQSGQAVCDVVVRKRHLRESGSYEVLQKDEWERLALVESMDFVKLTYKNVTWVVKLKWENGKLYFGRMWNAFAKAGNMRKGDTIAFQKTENAQKYMICIFERDLCTKCNHAGQKSAIMDWLKIANFEFISKGEMEIPRVFRDSPGVSIPEKVNLILRDGETVVVKYSPERKLHSLEWSQSILCKRVMLIIVVSDDSDEDVEDVLFADDPDVADNAEVDATEVVAEPISFRVTLRASHVDKRQHRVYLSPSIYSTYKSWTALTNVRLIFGARISFVSILRSGKVCRFGKGWCEFTMANELVEGQVLQLDYINDFTFQVQVV